MAVLSKHLGCSLFYDLQIISTDDKSTSVLNNLKVSDDRTSVISNRFEIGFIRIDVGIAVFLRIDKERRKIVLKLSQIGVTIIKPFSV